MVSIAGPVNDLALGWNRARFEPESSSGGRKRDKRTSRLYEITMKGEQVIRYFKEAKDLGLDEAIIPL